MTAHEEGIEAAGRALLPPEDSLAWRCARDYWEVRVRAAIAAYASKQPRVSDEEIDAAFEAADKEWVVNSTRPWRDVVGKHITQLLDRAAWAGVATTPTVKDSLLVAANDEEANISYCRATWGSSSCVGVLLTAYDRVTRERDEAREQTEATIAANGGVVQANIKLLGERDVARRTIEQRDARIAELEGQIAKADETESGLRIEIFELEAAHDQMRAQLAARADAKPLGWLNFFENGSLVFYTSAEAAERIAKECNDYGIYTTSRVAVPVYEYPPAVSASVRDLGSIDGLDDDDEPRANPMEAYNAGRRGVRRIVQMSVFPIYEEGRQLCSMVFLCDDGTVWARTSDKGLVFVCASPTAEVPNV